MNFPLLTAALRGSDLSMSQRMILTILLNHANPQGKAWPSQETIALQAACTSRTVRTGLRVLEQQGWIAVRSCGGRYNVYTLRSPAQAQVQLQAPAPVEAGPVSTSASTSASATATFSGEPRCVDLGLPPRNVLPVVAQEPRNVFPVSPAASSYTPEMASGDPGNGFLQTTHEPPISFPKNHPQGADKPPEEGVKEEKEEGHRKGEWRNWNSKQAAKVNGLSLPTEAPPEFEAAWRRWCGYRTRRATEARIPGEALPWTPDLGAATLLTCERHAAVRGWPAIISRMDDAIAGGWRGMNFDTMRAAPAPQATATTVGAAIAAATASAHAARPRELCEQQKTVAAWVFRPADIPWSAKEWQLWDAIPKPIHPEMWSKLTHRYEESNSPYLKRSLAALLADWNQEFDHANTSPITHTPHSHTL